MEGTAFKQASTPVALRADRHYEALRDAVWLRVVASDPGMPWAAFEDAYQEAWAWISARQGEGRPVVADSGSPVAYLAQAVRRRYVDELRGARRGLARTASAPVVEPLEDHAERISAPSNEDDAREARRAVSAIYLLACERLTRRELQAFALAYLLEMKPAEAARAMGVSAKRFRNLRWDSWRKVGRDVVDVLEGRLDWCASTEAAELRSRALAGDPEARRPLRVHLASCPDCSHRIAEARRAAALLLPLPFVLGDPGGRAQRIADAFEVARERLAARLSRPALRAGEWTAVNPPAGRIAAAAIVLASVTGAGSAPPRAGGEAERAAETIASDHSLRLGRSRPVASATAPRSPARQARDRRPRERPAAPAAAAAAQAPAPIPPVPAGAATRSAPDQVQLVPAPVPPTSGEFGFE